MNSTALCYLYIVYLCHRLETLYKLVTGRAQYYFFYFHRTASFPIRQSMSSVSVTDWGNVNARTLGTENVVIESSILGVKKYLLTYPKVRFFEQ